MVYFTFFAFAPYVLAWFLGMYGGVRSGSLYPSMLLPPLLLPPPLPPLLLPTPVPR